MRNVFLLALLGLALVVGLALVSGRGALLAGAGGIGVLLTTGIRWRRAARSAHR